MKISEILKKTVETDNSVFLYSAPLYKSEKCYLCTSAEYEYNINTISEYRDIFEKIKRIKNTHITICLMKYEMGYLFEPKLNGFLPNNSDDWLIKVLSFKKINCKVFNNSEIIHDSISSGGGFKVDNFRLNVSEAEYNRAIKRVKEYIFQGDTYQVNYTVKGKFNFTGNPEVLFLNLIANQSTKYSAFINLKDETIISISPELFFQFDGNRILTRPMKGTIRRGLNLQEDRLLKETLFESEKDRAENVMIVDLLRNDFGRVSKFGTVKADSLFDIEKYETVFQMVSSVEGKCENTSLSKIIENVFPCGSITGAPKIRTMEIINELEKEERGIYTGSIGVIEGDKALFNVAIRTLVINKEKGIGEVGLGGGIVWDSLDEKEFKEVKLKGKFLTRMDEPFQLIETILFEKGEYFLLDYHLKRLKESADYFLFLYNQSGLLNTLTEVSKQLNPIGKFKVRVLLDKYGKMDISWSEYKEITGGVSVKISDKKTSSKNKFHYFKTTSRTLYDTELKEAASDRFFDVLFFNERDELTEGAITNIFLLKDGIWTTPPISSGILDGCYRKHFLKTVNCLEKTLNRDDLLSAERVILVNSVRKKIEVLEIGENGKIIWNA